MKIIILTILLGAFFPLISTFAQPYGLTQAVAVDKYMNQLLPAGTPDSGGWTVENAFPNLSFNDLTVLTVSPETNLFHAGTRDGLIHYFDIDASATTKMEFLDIRAQVEMVADGGLLGIAFHPKFRDPTSPENYVYLFYCAKGTPTNFLRLERYTVPAGQSHADLNSAEVLVNMTLRGVLHRGGGLTFGNDGFLYLTIGDQNDLTVPQEKTTSFEGKVIRIDVDEDPTKSHAIIKHLSGAGEFSGNYMIPDDNPFQDPSGADFEEIYSLGHRNPHRMSCDPVTGNLWVGEVGSNKREEINIITSGGNHGWPFMEGTTPGQVGQPSTLIGTLSGPLVEFTRPDANSVIGGYVYRGSTHSYLYGKYICGDYRKTKIFAIDWDGAGAPVVEELMDAGPLNVTTFGIDHNGEVYICSLGSNLPIYKLAQSTSSYPQPPALLSQTGAFQVSSGGDFTGMTEMVPIDAMIPFEPNTPFWSDGAEKSRWFTVPNNGSFDAANEKISFNETGKWSFPLGSVFVKHFELPVNDTDPTEKRKIETRFLVNGEGEKIYGVTYRWRPDGSDADLLLGGLEESISIQTAGGGTRNQTWKYPSRGECLACHNQVAGEALGIRTNQLNGKYLYATSGVADNQLRALNHIGLLEPALSEAEIGGLPRMIPGGDIDAPLQERIRSYMESNCSYCHQPGSGILTSIDTRMQTPLPYQGLVEATPYDPLGISGAMVISPGMPSQSVLFHRLDTLNPERMPPLGSTVLDTLNISRVEDWITMLQPNVLPKRGLFAQYYKGKGFNEFKYDTVDDQINFSWGDSSPNPALLGVDKFSARWTGYILADHTENYQFKVISDNGFRLWIDNQLVIERWDPQGSSVGYIVETGYKQMEAGKPVKIQAEYYEDTLGAVARLFWSSPSVSEQTVPASRLLQSLETVYAPQASGESAVVDVNSSVTVNVVKNDAWFHGHLDYTSLEIVNQPNHGTLEYISWCGDMIYTHNGNGATEDSFSYTIKDSLGQTSNIAVVDLDINQPVNPTFALDGNLDDYGANSVNLSDPNDVSDPNSHIDLLQMAVGSDEESIYVGYLNDGPVQLHDGWFLFFDADQDPATGYSAGGLGAEYMLRGLTFYTYTGNGNNWSWQQGSTAASVYGSNIIEFAIPRSWFGGSSGVDVFFYGDNSVTGGTEMESVELAGMDSRHDFIGTEVAPPVMLDGSLDDWGAEAFHQTDPVDVNTGAPKIDLTDLYITESPGQMYVGYRNDPYVTWSNGWKLYMDTDQNTSTGEPIFGLGADFLLEANSIFSWGSGGWNYVGSGATGGSTTALEFGFPKAWIGGAATFDLVFFGDNSVYSGTVDELVPDSPNNTTLTYAGITQSQIVIDGDLSDWGPGATTIVDGIDIAAGGNNNIDLVELRVTHDAGKAYFAYINKDPIALNQGMQLYIDLDQDPSTGYSVYGMGADLLIRSGSILKYNGSNGGWGWSYEGPAGVAGNGSIIEIGVDRIPHFDGSTVFDFAFFGANIQQYGGTQNEHVPNSANTNPGTHSF